MMVQPMSLLNQKQGMMGEALSQHRAYSRMNHSLNPHGSWTQDRVSEARRRLVRQRGHLEFRQRAPYHFSSF